MLGSHFSQIFFARGQSQNCGLPQNSSARLATSHKPDVLFNRLEFYLGGWFDKIDKILNRNQGVGYGLLRNR
jgi:hypothetical protein